MRDAFIIRPEMVGAGLVGLAALTLISLVPDAQTGFVLTWALALVKLLGWGYYLAWVILGYLGVWLIRRFGMENDTERWEKPAGALLALLTFTVLAEIFDPGHSGTRGDFGGGGSAGWFIVQLFGGWGALLLFTPAAIAASVIMIGPWSLRDVGAMIGRYWGDLRHQRRVGHIPVKSGAAPTEQSPARPAIPAPAAAPVVESVWQLPDITRILKAEGGQKINPAEARERAQVIERTLAGLGIEVVVKEINQGPVVTQFALEPGHTKTRNPDGSLRRVSVKKLAGLGEDLALALAASPIRIEAPIPGRPYVGVEAPNRQRLPVTLRGVLESAGMTALTYPRHKLSVPLGQSVDGEAIFIDLAAQPHLLIAGATGSGKSVCLNALIAGLLCYHTPETLRMMMFDPKLVELAQYNGIPHLMTPVITEVERAVGALGWAVREMERRYRELAKVGARNIGVYNEKMSRGDRLPFIALIIDELADLMMVGSEQVESPIVRLAQKARAVGIHLVVATQRPSTDVLTGLLKANFPARIAFAVSSQTDSRVILDASGADKLLGRGDMLYQSPRSVRLRRLQGAYISDGEVAALVRFWKRQRRNAPVQSEQVDIPVTAAADNAGDREGENDLLRQATDLVREQGKASITMLQREFRIGYSRAASLMDALEAQGVVGPAQSGNRAREVL